MRIIIEGVDLDESEQILECNNFLIRCKDECK